VLPTLAQPDLEPRLVRQRFHAADARRDGEAVVEANAAPEASERPAVGGAMHLHLVHALDRARRMHETVRQGAVVREEQEAAALEVEAADRIDAGPQTRDEVAHGRPALRIGQRADDAAGLVQGDRPRPGGSRQALAVDGDLVPGGIRARPELADHRAVDGDATRADQRFGLTS
jgi:hypothetical protein